jgi:hypothetical protein
MASASILTKSANYIYNGEKESLWFFCHSDILEDMYIKAWSGVIFPSLDYTHNEQ